MPYFERTKTNLLKKPSHLKKVDSEINDRWNWCGQPHAQIGDYVLITGFSGVNVGTVGKVIDIHFNEIAELNAQGHQIDDHYTHNTPATIEFLDGHIDEAWLWSLTVIDYNAVQEVKDFYINDGRVDQIKVSW